MTSKLLDLNFQKDTTRIGPILQLPDFKLVKNQAC